MEEPESKKATHTLNLDHDKPIVLKMQVQEDVPAELEAFVRLSRLGLYEEALDWYNRCLSRFPRCFPIIAEYAEMLLEADFSREYEVLFNPIQPEDRFVTGIQETDRETASKLVELWRAVGRVRWSHGTEWPVHMEPDNLYQYWDFLKFKAPGQVLNSLKSERYTWARRKKFVTPLDLISESTTSTRTTALQIQMVELYLRIAVSLFQKGLLPGGPLLNPPWSQGSPWSGFWEWHKQLSSSKSYHWEAQMIQSLLLQVSTRSILDETFPSIILDKEAMAMRHTAREEALVELDEARMISELIMSNNLCSYLIRNFNGQREHERELLRGSWALKEALCTMSSDTVIKVGKPILQVSELAEAFELKRGPQYSW